jgi:GTP cyclohydrolase I
MTQQPTSKQFDTKQAAITAFPTPIARNGLSDEEKIAKIAVHFKAILETLELDLTNESLQRTPERIASMYVEEVFSGLKLENFPSISVDKDPSGGNQMILVKNIPFTSFCEHHLVPMSGEVSVAYIPNGTIIGLSKVNRIVHYFASRPQVQERLSAQIGDSLSGLMNTDDVAIIIQASHSCVTARGIRDHASVTRTHSFRGVFESDATKRQELLSSL